MTQPSATVRVDLSGLRRFSASVDQASGPFVKCVKQWAARYRGFIQERYNRFSRGGGNWPPLKRKRKRGALARASILRDTNTMFAAVSPQFAALPGQLEERIPFGVRVGYGGPSRHPKAGMSVADLANIHQLGLGVVPAREIIVDPSPALVTAMAGDADRAVRQLSQDTNTV